jgi:hypothetical protein
MINARASVSLAGAAHQRGVAGRTHAHRGLCAGLLGAAVPQDVHAASTPLGWIPPRCSAVPRDLPALSLSPPLSQDLLRGRAISIPTGCALVVRHALQPWPGATLGTGVQRGMVHRHQVRCRSRRVIRCHK